MGAYCSSCAPAGTTDRGDALMLARIKRPDAVVLDVKLSDPGR
jgi:hypothetical protein